MEVLVSVIAALVVAEGLLTILCLRQVGLLAEGLENSEPPTPLQGPIDSMPNVQAFDLRQNRDVQLSWPGRPALVIALTTECGACDELMADLKRVSANVSNKDVILAVLATPAVAHDYVSRFDIPEEVSVLAHPALRRALHVRVTPYAFIVDGDGGIKSRGIANHADHIANLLAGHSADGLPRPARLDPEEVPL